MFFYCCWVPLLPHIKLLRSNRCANVCRYINTYVHINMFKCSFSHSFDTNNKLKAFFFAFLFLVFIFYSHYSIVVSCWLYCSYTYKCIYTRLESEPLFLLLLAFCFVYYLMPQHISLYKHLRALSDLLLLALRHKQLTWSVSACWVPNWRTKFFVLCSAFSFILLIICSLPLFLLLYYFLQLLFPAL